MNRKGFTLIELLAVIVILGIILTFAVPSITNIYKESKLKTEGMFLNELSKSIDSYVTLNSDKIAFNEKKTATKTENNQSLSVTVYEGKISIKDLIDDKIIEEKDYINPGNKNATCEKTTKIVKVYRDSDYVYCYKVNKNALNCLTAEYKNSLDSDYAIDTCIWK